MPGHHVSDLKLSHFRSHLSGELSTGGRSVILSGANGSGKTSVLEALSMLSPGRGLRGVSADDASRLPERIGWKVFAELSISGRSTSVETYLQEGTRRKVRINFKSAAQTELGRTLRVLWITPAMDRLWIEGADGRRRFLDRTAMSFFPEHPADVAAYEKAMRERNRLFREGIIDSHWFEALEARMSDHGARITSNRMKTLDRLLKESASATTSFPAAHLELAAPENGGGNVDEPKDLAAMFRDFRKRDSIAGRTSAGPHRADVLSFYKDRGVAARSCSTGEQKALLISLVLANARALSRELGAAPVLLLDEVAAHLDEDRRRSLFDEIRLMDAQVWMTGTDSALFAGAGSDAVRVEVSSQCGRSHMEKRAE